MGYIFLVLMGIITHPMCGWCGDTYIPMKIKKEGCPFLDTPLELFSRYFENLPNTKVGRG